MLNRELPDSGVCRSCRNVVVCSSNSAFNILPLCMPFSVMCVNFAAYTQIIGKNLFAVVLVVDGFFGVVCFSFLLIPSLKMNGLYLCVTIIIAFAVKDIKHFSRNMEDIAGDVVTHGFSSDNRDHSADICVSCRKNDVILRLRDNCIAFNPTERLDIVNPKGDAKNARLRILLGLNVLVIRI